MPRIGRVVAQNKPHHIVQRGHRAGVTQGRGQVLNHEFDENLIILLTLE